jgi:hypothetical protein
LKHMEIVAIEKVSTVSLWSNLFVAVYKGLNSKQQTIFCIQVLKFKLELEQWHWSNTAHSFISR